MKVHELIAILQKHDPELPVLLEHFEEGTVRAQGIRQTPHGLFILDYAPEQMQPIEFIGYRETNCERMAARHHLTFHCDGYFITEHDDDREAREATEPELAMWQALTGDFDPENLPATAAELRSSWAWQTGPFTISPKDAEVLFRMDASEWKPETDALQCQMGCLGWYKNKPVYVSRAIPTGYFYEGPRIPEIHFLPHADMQPRPDAEVPPEIEAKVGMALKPFMTSWT